MPVTSFTVARLVRMGWSRAESEAVDEIARELQREYPFANFWDTIIPRAVATFVSGARKEQTT